MQGFCVAAQKWRVCDVTAFFPVVVSFGRFSVPCTGFCLPWWLIKCMYTTSYISAKIDNIWLAIWWDLKGCPIQARYPFRVSNLNLALLYIFIVGIYLVQWNLRHTAQVRALKQRTLYVCSRPDFLLLSFSWNFLRSHQICFSMRFFTYMKFLALLFLQILL